jgi:hypothetical protein
MQRRTFLKLAVSSLTLALPPMAGAWMPDFSSISACLEMHCIGEKKPARSSTAAIYMLCVPPPD